VRSQEFLTGLGKEEAPAAIPADYHAARDYTPQLSVGGGLLVAVLGYWLVIGGLFSTDLFDLSTSYGPYPLAATSANIATLTGKLTGCVDASGLPQLRTDLQRMGSALGVKAG
jgi:hypothetical protein